MDRFGNLLAVQIENPHPPMPRHSGLVGVAVFTIGLALLCYGAVPLVRTRRWRAQAFPALGRVVDNVPRLGRRGRTGWLPLIEFEAAGSSITSAIAGAPARRGWPLGYAVDVLYDPANPSVVRRADPGFLLPWPFIGGLVVMAGFFGAIFI